jgi:phospholipid transport system substrate-binding protein
MQGTRNASMALSKQIVLAAMVCAAVRPGPSLAQVETGSRVAPIVALDAALIAVMKASDRTPFMQRYQILAPVIDQVFDLDRVIKVSVGPYWAGLSSIQQETLELVFRRYTITTYVANFDTYSGEVANVSSVTRTVGAEQVVTSTLSAPGQDARRIDYVMGRNADTWKVQDILLDGTISRVAVQRSDFDELLSEGSAALLIRGLEQKISTLSGGAITS